MRRSDTRARNIGQSVFRRCGDGSGDHIYYVCRVREGMCKKERWDCRGSGRAGATVTKSER